MTAMADQSIVITDKPLIVIAIETAIAPAATILLTEDTIHVTAAAATHATAIVADTAHVDIIMADLDCA
jgi:hypothetical protein